MVGQDQIIIITKQYETLRDLLNVGKEAIEQEIANKTPDTNFHEVEILSPVTNQPESFAKEQTMVHIGKKQGWKRNALLLI